MSRMGNKPIALDPKVKLDVSGQDVSVTGPKGTLKYQLPEGITLKQDGDVLHVLREREDDKELKMKHGLVRSLLNAMIVGTSTGFKQELELFGVGYRAQLAGQKLTLSLGYSKPIEYTVPETSRSALIRRTSAWRALTSSWLARLPRRSAVSAPPMPTMARACAMPANRSR